MSAVDNIPGPELVRVPAGAFSMGSEEGATWEKPVHRIEVSELSIGRLPVTNAEYRAFRPEHRSPMDDRDEAPVTGVSWEDTAAYCQWLSAKSGYGFRLPTESEWEKAIRGGLEQKKYPWGDDPPVPPNKVDDHDYRPDPRPNPYGVIAGTHNLWEWVADYYDAEYFRSSPARDPKGPSAGEYRVLRGGGYPGDFNSVRCYSRGSARPRTSSERVTFRVASSAAPATLVSELRPPPGPPPASGRATPAPRPVSAESARASIAASPSIAAQRPSQSPPASIPRPGTSVANTVLRDVEVTASDEEVTVYLRSDGTPQYKTMVLKAPDRLVVDLQGTVVGTKQSPGALDVALLGVTRIRWALFQSEPPVARIVVDLENTPRHTVETAADGLVIRIVGQD